MSGRRSAGTVNVSSSRASLQVRSVGRCRTSWTYLAEAGAGAGAYHLDDVVRARSPKPARPPLKEIGAAYRSPWEEIFPAMAVVEVSGLVEDEALVEIQATAVMDDASWAHPIPSSAAGNGNRPLTGVASAGRNAQEESRWVFTSGLRRFPATRYWKNGVTLASTTTAFGPPRCEPHGHSDMYGAVISSVQEMPTWMYSSSTTRDTARCAGTPSSPSLRLRSKLAS